MAGDDSKLLAGFHQAMLGIYTAARKIKPPYTPSDFLSMVNEHGGKGAADLLLASKKPSSGFTELFIRGKENLKLSVEYLVLTSPWRQLFHPDQLATARRRLLEVGCDPPPDDMVEEPVDVPLPEEVPADQAFQEGSVRRVLINAYERSAAAREECIKVHGAVCVVCGFDFGAAYGLVAEGFIHVHHLRPLAEIGGGYVIDPIADLRPVCPNCHAVIHLDGKCRDIEEVRILLGSAKQ